MEWYWTLLIVCLYIVASVFVTEIFSAWLAYALNDGEKLDWSEPSWKNISVLASYLLWPVFPLTFIFCYAVWVPTHWLSTVIFSRDKQSKREKRLKAAVSRQDLADAERRAAEAFIAARKAEAEAAALNDGMWPPAPKHE